MTRSPVACAAIAVILFAAQGLADARAEAEQAQRIGFLEDVRVYPGNVLFKAKIDTGARTSSLHVEKFEEFHRAERKWIRFTVINKAGEAITLERPIVRTASVRRTGTDTQERYVVNLTLCMGGYYKLAEVNLTDRSGMNYRMLIGRLFLGDRFLVDASKKYLTTPDCAEARRP